jgi:hypothetical protein
VRRSLVLTTATVAAALVAIALACGSNRIPIAETVPDDGGHSPCEIDGGARCRPGQFCAKNSCDSNDGVCWEIESDACAGPDPVCGCDGITYYNSCVRLSAQAGFAFHGGCIGQIGVIPKHCSDSRACRPYNAFCAVVLPTPPRSFSPPSVDGAAIPCAAAGEALSMYLAPYLASCWAFADAASLPVCDDAGCIEDIDSVRSGRFPPFCMPDASLPPRP